jgi:hypothetical protein
MEANMSAVEHEISDEEYMEMLDDIYPEIDVCGYKYPAGQVLKEVDPIAFDCGKSDLMQWECSKCCTVYDEESEAEDCDCETDGDDEESAEDN